MEAITVDDKPDAIKLIKKINKNGKAVDWDSGYLKDEKDKGTSCQIKKGMLHMENFNKSNGFSWDNKEWHAAGAL